MAAAAAAARDATRLEPLVCFQFFYILILFLGPLKHVETAMAAAAAAARDAARLEVLVCFFLFCFYYTSLFLDLLNALKWRWADGSNSRWYVFNFLFILILFFRSTLTCRNGDGSNSSSSSRRNMSRDVMFFIYSVIITCGSNDNRCGHLSSHEVNGVGVK